MPLPIAWAATMNSTKMQVMVTNAIAKARNTSPQT